MPWYGSVNCLISDRPFPKENRKAECQKALQEIILEPGELWRRFFPFLWRAFLVSILFILKLVVVIRPVICYRVAKLAGAVLDTLNAMIMFMQIIKNLVS